MRQVKGAMSYPAIVMVVAAGVMTVLMVFVIPAFEGMFKDFGGKGQLPKITQLVVAFSPDNEFGFKRVVMLQDGEVYSLGFLTKEFTVDRGQGPEPMAAVYVPTNHLYLGDIVIVESARVTYPDIPVEEGLRIFLTGGMALPTAVRQSEEGDPASAFRV